MVLKKKRRKTKLATIAGTIGGAIIGATAVSAPFLVYPPLYGKALIGFMAWQGALVGRYLATRRFRKRRWRRKWW